MLPITEQERRMSMRITDYDILRQRVVDIVKGHDPNPRIWLDTGCGCGGSARYPVQMFKETQFVLADPSEDNIRAAKETMQGEQRCLYVTNPTHRLNMGDNTIDVITAIMSHHYYKDMKEKASATANCYRMLKGHGIYIATEHVRYERDQEYMDEQWAGYMRSKALPEEMVQEMLSRRFDEYFPLTEDEMISHIKDAGFTKVNVFWRTCSDIGIVAIK